MCVYYLPLYGCSDMYIYVCVYVYVLIYIDFCRCVYICVCVFVCMHGYIYTYTHVYNCSPHHVFIFFNAFCFFYMLFNMRFICLLNFQRLASFPTDSQCAMIFQVSYIRVSFRRAGAFAPCRDITRLMTDSQCIVVTYCSL